MSRLSTMRPSLGPVKLHEGSLTALLSWRQLGGQGYELGVVAHPGALHDVVSVGLRDEAVSPDLDNVGGNCGNLHGDPAIGLDRLICSNKHLFCLCSQTTSCSSGAVVVYSDLSPGYGNVVLTVPNNNVQPKAARTGCSCGPAINSCCCSSL